MVYHKLPSNVYLIFFVYAYYNVLLLVCNFYIVYFTMYV